MLSSRYLLVVCVGGKWRVLAHCMCPSDLPLGPLPTSSQSLGEDEEGIPMRPLRIMNGDPERRSNLVIKE